MLSNQTKVCGKCGRCGEGWGGGGWDASGTHAVQGSLQPLETCMEEPLQTRKHDE